MGANLHNLLGNNKLKKWQFKICFFMGGEIILVARKLARIYLPQTLKKTTCKLLGAFVSLGVSF